MKDLTAEEQELHKKGVEAQEFLSNPAMASAINELSESIGNTMLNSAPEETDKRERLYHLHTALKELVAILNHRVSVKQNLEAQMDEPENE